MHTSWGHLVHRFRSAGISSNPAATPFQSGAWLQAWYDTLGAQPGSEPLPLELRDAHSGKPVFGIPLVKRMENSQQIIEFADGYLTDYNAPLIGSGFRAGTQTTPGINPREILRVLRDQLNESDLLRLVKMPATLMGCANPFALLPGKAESTFGTNVVSIEDSWADYRKRLAKKVRKELERSFRVFQRDGVNAHFETIEDPAEAVAVLEKMEALQADRMRALELPFILNEPQFSAFYRRLIELDLVEGRLLLTVIRSEPDQLVGALLGLRDGSSYAMVRLAHAGDAWSHCSPGKLIIDKTMQHLHSQGVTRFDFTTGEYSYKKSFLTRSEPLVDVTLGLSLKGRINLAAATIASAAKEQFRNFPRIYAMAKKLVTS